MLFLSPDPAVEKTVAEKFESIVREEGQTVLGWREVPTDNSSLGETAAGCEPAVRQVFVGRGGGTGDGIEFERKLYVMKFIEAAFVSTRTSPGPASGSFTSSYFRTSVSPNS